MSKLFCAVLLVLVGINAMAEDQEEPGKLQLTLSTKIWSQYLLNSGVVFHDKPVLQTDAFLALPKGFYLDLWWSAGLNDAKLSSDFGDEIDYTVGWAGEVGKKLVLDVGVSYFDLYQLFDTGGDGDVIKPYAKLSRTFPVGKQHELTPLLAIEYHHPLKNLPSGVYAWTGLKDVWAVNEKLFITQEAGVLYDSGAYGFKERVVGYGTWEASWQLTKKFSMQLPSVKLTTPLSDSDRDTELAYGVGLTIKF